MTAWEPSLFAWTTDWEYKRPRLADFLGFRQGQEVSWRPLQWTKLDDTTPGGAAGEEIPTSGRLEATPGGNSKGCGWNSKTESGELQAPLRSWVAKLVAPSCTILAPSSNIFFGPHFLKSFFVGGWGTIFQWFWMFSFWGWGSEIHSPAHLGPPTPPKKPSKYIKMGVLNVL